MHNTRTTKETSRTDREDRQKQELRLVSATVKRGFWKRGKLRKFWFSRVHVPLLLLPVAVLGAFVFKYDARNGPPPRHTRPQNPAPPDPSKRPLQCGNLRENFQQNAEIVGNCVSHILDVKHCKTRGAENVGKCRKFGRQFSADP